MTSVNKGGFSDEKTLPRSTFCAAISNTSESAGSRIGSHRRISPKLPTANKAVVAAIITAPNRKVKQTPLQKVQKQNTFAQKSLSKNLLNKIIETTTVNFQIFNHQRMIIGMQ